MIYDWTMKKDDLLPSLKATLKGADNLPIDLTDATSVRFHMRVAGEAALKVNAAADFVAPRTSGVVQYDWVVGDTNTEGEYEGEFEVMFPGSKPLTVPNSRHMSILVYEEIA